MDSDARAALREITAHTTTEARLLEIARASAEHARLIPKHRRSIPLAVYRELASSSDMPTRAAVARDPEAPLEVLERLAHDRQWTVAKALFGGNVRRHVAVPDTLYETVAGHTRFTVRQSVAEHSDCPAPVLERLARDPAPEVRRAVAGHPKASAELLRQLADDADNLVVWNVAGHPHASDATLDLLAEHAHAHTRQLSIQPYLSYGRSRTIPAERLVRLADDPERGVVEDIIAHRAAPTWLVEQILERRPELFDVAPELYNRGGTVYGSLSNEPLARAAAQHPDLCEGLLERMADVRGTRICQVLIAHPRLTPALAERLARTCIEHLAELAAAPPVSDDAARKLVADLRFSASSSLAHVAMLEGLPEPTQRASIAALGAIPLHEHIIAQLLGSPHAAVRAFAAGRTPAA